MKVQFVRVKETKSYIKFEALNNPAVPIAQLYFDKEFAGDRETITVDVPAVAEVKVKVASGK